MTSGANVGYAIMSALIAKAKAHPRIRVSLQCRKHGVSGMRPVYRTRSCIPSSALAGLRGTSPFCRGMVELCQWVS